MVEKNYLTQDWHDKLKNELSKLVKETLPSILDRLKEAVWQWDISENAEYETAIQEKDLVESRINQIKMMLDNVEIIEELHDSEVVRHWAKVLLEDEKKQTYEYTIVWTWEVDILTDKTISFDSPLWLAIKWKKEWDEVSIRAPRWRQKIKILKVN